MADQTVVRTLIIRGKSEGVDQVAASTEKLARSLEHVAVATDTATKRSLSIDQSYARQTRALDATARAQFNIEKATKIADQALKQGLVTQSEHAARLQLINRSYQIATGSNNAFTEKAKLSRYELINLSRQIQDVGVSLASGQSPFTVLVQQGTQIADVFAASSGTVRGFFGQVLGAVRSVITPLRLFTVGGIAAAAAGTLIGHNWEDTGKTIRRAFDGLGAAVGATEGDILRVGRATSSFTGMTQSAAREVALSFVRIGTVGVQNLEPAVRTSEKLGASLGKDVAAGAEILIKAFQGGRKGIEDFLATRNLLDGATREQLALLDRNIDKTQLYDFVLRKVSDSLRDASDNMTSFQKLGNALSNIFTEGPQPGAGGTGVSDERQKQIEVEQRFQEQLLLTRNALVLAGEATRQYDDALAASFEKVQQLTEAQRLLNEQQQSARPRLLAESLREIVDAAQPAEARIKQLGIEIAQLQQALSTPGVAESLGAETVRRVQEVTAAKQVQRQLTQEQLQTEKNQVAVVQTLAALYPGITSQTAAQLALGQSQLAVAKARTGQEQIAAQEILRANQLILQGVSAYEALKIAAQERAIAEAQISTQFDNQIKNMQIQLKIAEANTAAEKERLQAQLAYQQAIQQGASPAQAGQIADLTRKTAEANRQNAEHTASMARTSGQIARNWRTIEDTLRDLEPLFTSGGRAFSGMLDATGTALVDRWLEDRGQSAFGGGNKATFGNFVEEVSDASAFKTAQTLFGAGGFEVLSPAKRVTTVAFRDVNTTTFPGQARPTEEGLRNIVDEVLSKGGSLQDAINKLTSLKDQPLFGIQKPDPAVLQSVILDLTRRIGEELGTPQAEMDFIRSEIERLRQQPRTLARDDAIAELNRRLMELSESTNDLNDTIGGILSPFYSQDPRTSRIGFRADSSPLTYDPFRPNGATPTQIIITQTPIAPTATVGGPIGLGDPGPVRTGPQPVPTPTSDTVRDSPFTQLRRTTSLGYIQTSDPTFGGTRDPYDPYSFAFGGIMGPHGRPIHIRRFADGGMYNWQWPTEWFNRKPYDWFGNSRPSNGITREPSLFSTSERGHGEAIIPLTPGGAVPVALMGGERRGGGNTFIINNEMIFEASPGAADSLRRTAFHAAEEVSRQVGQVAGRA